ncbi:hypothetical protein I6N95_11810 [Vagococcus sp. BWB3-3]|uniref:Uncharacterized protein n=1 Tax=Vagococcus allomyrinae TaxID=2794353 RepID=A0A940PB09_9ENTE|nr:hypothetical protein [Vagococcus allomyrinae]MBP1041694.1 hypothetical protein [Vagococcus allomyrinae]
MFRFRKKEAKPSPENDWHELMVTFFSDSVIDLTNTFEKEYWLTYGLGYLSAYLKSVKAKDKIVEQVECQMLEEFGNYSKEEAGFLRKRIERSTSNQSPLYQELIFKGLEVFSESTDEQSKALMVKKIEISELLAAEVDGKERA